MNNQYPHLFKLLFVYNFSFSSIYLCERTLSDMLTLTNSKRNKLDFEKGVLYLNDIKILKYLLKNCN